MVKIETFEIDRWIMTHGPRAKHNLASSYCASISVNELSSLSTADDGDKDPWTSLLATPMNYGPLKGSEALRQNISNLYSKESPGAPAADNILITPGGSLANFIAVYALVGPADHVIVQYPTYQQLYALPAGVGAEVSLWKAKEDEGWALDVDELKGLVRPNTKMIILNNPVNPTGTAIPKSKLAAIVALATHHSITILCDEIYYPLFHSIPTTDPERPPSILSFGYKNVIVTSTLSKAYSLAGIRIGWLASHDPTILDLCINARAYALITVSQLDDQLAAFALSPPRLDTLIAKNITLVRRNLALVQELIDRHPSICQWTPPVATPIGFIKLTRSGRPVDDVDFCIRLLREKSVLLVPGSKCYGNGVEFKGYVRLGFGCQTEQLREALQALERFLEEEYALPVL
ncbi:putative aminotransferase [Aspergillus mulundensis]|uniref:Aminotransferase class I/classII large domain-containing protein n=1 Tax=Aspergillus mulundensis TaxID=1810919 RepID=A0A3D8QUW7_9EURO|nr:Uncharacterized protein DSM5745_09392 [Aspergillus mulundensis]RDW65653.1 Uncharacterized protein DSM5745_09392 [Aspergillus mulundensis]